MAEEGRIVEVWDLNIARILRLLIITGQVLCAFIAVIFVAFVVFAIMFHD
jgi:hypothetical protein